MEPEQPTTDQQMLEVLQAIHESMVWSIAFQVVTFCILLFCLFFISMKAGKSG
jgi:hypothetical protein